MLAMSRWSLTGSNDPGGTCFWQCYGVLGATLGLDLSQSGKGRGAAQESQSRQTLARVWSNFSA